MIISHRGGIPLTTQGDWAGYGGDELLFPIGEGSRSLRRVIGQDMGVISDYFLSGWDPAHCIE